MKAELKAEWIKALRSGRYEQGLNFLQRGNNYCCLGVLLIIAENNGFEIRREVDGEIIGCTWAVQPALTKLLPALDQSTLQRMNDQEDKSFPEIADWIEQNVEAT